MPPIDFESTPLNLSGNPPRQIIHKKAFLLYYPDE